MLNPSNRFDLNIGWAMAHRQMVRNGDAWVGHHRQADRRAGAEEVRPRALRLAVVRQPAGARRSAQLPEPGHVGRPADARSRTTEDGLAWDIYSQVGALRAQPRPRQPAGLRRRPPRLAWRAPVRRVKHVYGFGYSQTGGYLYDYINAIHPLDVARNGGHPIYDGYIVAVAGGELRGHRADQPVRAAAARAGDPRLQFSNVGVPIIHVMSQSDYLFGIDARRPDSDAPADRYRHYEMAGAAHATPDELNFSAAPADIVKAGVAVPPMNCNEGPAQPLPEPHLLRRDAAQPRPAGCATGSAPPHADPIDGGERRAGVLDEFGNVVGGLRSPYLDVPTSTWFGSSTGASFCFIAGHEVPFDAARLQQLYPTHGAYVRAVVKDTARLVAGRYITAYDGLDLIREAAQADVP